MWLSPSWSADIVNVRAKSLREGFVRNVRIVHCGLRISALRFCGFTLRLHCCFNAIIRGACAGEVGGFMTSGIDRGVGVGQQRIDCGEGALSRFTAST